MPEIDALRLDAMDKAGIDVAVLSLFQPRIQGERDTARHPARFRGFAVVPMQDPSPLAYRILAACYAYMGRLDEAREALNRLRLITPVVVPSASRQVMRKPEHYELFITGLRLAAGEL